LRVLGVERRVLVCAACILVTIRYATPHNNIGIYSRPGINYERHPHSVFTSLLFLPPFGAEILSAADM